MTDIEIAQKAKKEHIADIAKKVNIPDEYLEHYGKYKAKIDNTYMKELQRKSDGKLILVTDINPTPFG